MRRLLALSLFLLPFAALAQPDPYEPTPLVPGTFELTVHDGEERTVEGMAVFVAHPEALGGGWTLLMDDGTELFAFERGSQPGLDGADFGDERVNGAPEDDVRASTSASMTRQQVLTVRALRRLPHRIASPLLRPTTST
ncbi:MAG: hypothetical protein HKN04_08755 [Rhodothermaceae bacterium]|nr:hypothetical protein [Rhodothermaceae bacterium]